STLHSGESAVVGGVSTVRFPGDSGDLTLRVDRVQGAVALPGVRRALRARQTAMTETAQVTLRRPQRRRPTFHPLTVAEVRQLTHDSVSIGFAVPVELRPAYGFPPPPP